jgi:hypothetical protein
MDALAGAGFNVEVSPRRTRYISPDEVVTHSYGSATRARPQPSSNNDSLGGPSSVVARLKAGNRRVATMPSGSRRGHRQRHTVASSTVDPAGQVHKTVAREIVNVATRIRAVATRDLTRWRMV